MIQRKTAKPPHLLCIYLLQLFLGAVISTVYLHFYCIYSVRKVSISKGGLGFSWGFVYHPLSRPRPGPQLSSLNYPQYQYKRRPNVETVPKQPDLSNLLWIFCLNMGMFEAEIITYLLILTRDPNLRNAYISHSCWFKFSLNYAEKSRYLL